MGGEYTEELYEKELHDPDNHDGVITHLEPDILECEVKWALESITVNNRMGKTRDLFKKIRDTKGTFHAKMSSIKDRNGVDLTEAEDIRKRWQEYTEELYKKELHNPDNHDGVSTDLEPDIWNVKSSGP